MLESLSHRSVLARGFAMIHRQDGILVRAAHELNAGDQIEISFADGDRRGVIEPDRNSGEAERPRAGSTKPKPGAGNQGSLF